MKAVISFKSDDTGKTVRVTRSLDEMPVPRVGDLVLAEGRPRQVSSRRFHVMGEKHSAEWGQFCDFSEGPCVEINLIG